MSARPHLGEVPEGCEELQLPFGIGSGRSAFGERVQMHFFVRGEDSRVIGRVWFDDMPVGPPGHSHGGAVAYVLDEAMGCAVWAAGRPSVAGELNIRYRHMTPLKTALTVESWIEGVDGRKSQVRSVLKSRDGEPLVEGRAIFVVLPKDKLAELAWK